MHVPSVLTTVAEEQARARRIKVQPTASQAGHWVKTPTATRALTDLIGMLPKALSAEVSHDAKKRKPGATLSERATQALAGAFTRLHCDLLDQVGHLSAWAVRAGPL